MYSKLCFGLGRARIHPGAKQAKYLDLRSVWVSKFSIRINIVVSIPLWICLRFARINGTREGLSFTHFSSTSHIRRYARLMVSLDPNRRCAAGLPFRSMLLSATSSTSIAPKWIASIISRVRANKAGSRVCKSGSKFLTMFSKWFRPYTPRMYS